ncbi:MAG: histidine ammonia-lyase [Candidatus Cyclobacteriaceae bacterium M2_1C_046]
MAKEHVISHHPLSVEQVSTILKEKLFLKLSGEAEKKIIRCREYLDQKIKNSTEPVYGINTGFGSLYNRHIDKENLNQLQENLVKSHACGMGNEVPEEMVKLMLLLKIQSLSYGHSGVQLATVERLIDFFNEDILPVIYELGSLGASGDLAPLAHLSLPLMGLGEVNFQGKRISGAQLLEIKNWQPIQLQAKEGLALLNGTQFMSAYGVWVLLHSQRLIDLANTISALSLDAFDGRIEPFLPQVHQIRAHPGQQQVAAFIYKHLESSKLIRQEKSHVQDPYSFRCIPQVHGATLDAIWHVKSVFVKEINSVTDNPNVFPEEDEIISAGNFHGQPLALTLDYLAIALAELGSISERRTYQLISGGRNLPNYLVANPGINSGLMIPQYTAAAMVSQNKQLCMPSSADSIVSSNGQEDHVSMGANAAVKCYQILQNLYRILAIELITATQALEFRRPLKSSPALEGFADNFRKEISFIENDRVLYVDLQKTEQFLREIEIPEN